MAFREAKNIANLALLIKPIFELHEGQFIKYPYIPQLTDRLRGAALLTVPLPSGG